MPLLAVSCCVSLLFVVANVCNALSRPNSIDFEGEHCLCLQFSKTRVRDSSAEAVMPSNPASSASTETSFLHVASAVALSMACCEWCCLSDAVRIFCVRALILLPEGWPPGLLTSDIVVLYLVLILWFCCVRWRK